MNYDPEPSRHGLAYDMSGQQSRGFGYEQPLNAMPGQALGQPTPGWVAVPVPPPPPESPNVTPLPRHRVAVAIVSLCVLLPISLALLLSGGDEPSYTTLVARMIALGMVCATIVAINLSFHNIRR